MTDKARERGIQCLHEAAMGGDEKFRLLRHHEVIVSGDEHLSNGCEQWVSVTEIFIGMKNVAGVFHPIRRRVNHLDALTAQQAKWE